MANDRIRSGLKKGARFMPKRLHKRLMNLSGQGTQRSIIKLADDPRRFDGYCFVAGLHRSGTTVLEHYIAAHFEISVLRANVAENEGQHLQDVMPVARDHGGPGRFAFDPAMHLAPPDRGEADVARDRLLRLWTPWAVGEAPMLLEKSPPNLTRIGWLRTVFPGARFIVMVRDPRVSAAATQKWSQTSIEELIYHWHVAHAAAQAAWGPDCIGIRYEDFCADPNAQLDRIAETGFLARRAEPLPIEPRFADLGNSNDKYLQSTPTKMLGPGAWDFFGPWF